MNAELPGIASIPLDARSQIIPRLPAVVVPTRYILLPLAATVTGYTVKAIERKIERGDWQEGKVWRRGPDGRILIDLLGYQKWVESA